MLSQGLSLNQAPPISVPFRFFLTAPIFGILIGIMFLIYPIDIVSNRFSPITIGIVHLFTLGILAMIVFGAMQQMMPVLSGSIIPKPRIFAFFVHTGLTLGTLCFSASFIFDLKYLLEIGVVFLSISFLVFFTFCIFLLYKVKFLTSTVNVMKLFALMGFFTAIFGFIIAFNHISSTIPENHYFFVNTHIVFGVFGFAVLLIMGISFQVIPMFYVAKDFPKFIQNKVPIFIFALIIAFCLFFFFGLDIYVLKLFLAVLLILFSFYALNSLSNRRRPVFDVTLWYWKLSLYFFIFAMLNWLFVPQDSPFLISIMFAFGFLYSLLQGMVYKIIPFLSWFHLSSKGHFTIPTMREMISEDMIKIHFFLHCTSLLFFLITPFLSNLFLLIGAGFFIASNILFFINCFLAIRKYNKIAKLDPIKMNDTLS